MFFSSSHALALRSLGSALMLGGATPEVQLFIHFPLAVPGAHGGCLSRSTGPAGDVFMTVPLISSRGPKGPAGVASRGPQDLRGMCSWQFLPFPLAAPEACGGCLSRSTEPAGDVFVSTLQQLSSSLHLHPSLRKPLMSLKGLGKTF